MRVESEEEYKVKEIWGWGKEGREGLARYTWKFIMKLIALYVNWHTNKCNMYLHRQQEWKGGIGINELQVCLEHTSWCSDDHICLKPLGRMAVESCTHSHCNNTRTVCSALHYLGRIPLSTKTVLWSRELDEGRDLFIEKISKVILHASLSYTMHFPYFYSRDQEIL